MLGWPAAGTVVPRTFTAGTLLGITPCRSALFESVDVLFQARSMLHKLWRAKRPNQCGEVSSYRYGVVELLSAAQPFCPFPQPLKF